MRLGVAALAVMTAGPALADPPAIVRLQAPAVRAAAEFRLPTVVAPSDPTFRLDDPRSRFATGYGGSMVDLFPIMGGKFRLSAGPRLFGRPGRPHLLDPEPLRLLPAFRASGPRMSRRMSPALLVGYGRPVEQGLTFGVDLGVVKGRMTPMPDRLGRLNRARANADLARGRPAERMNQLMRATALYRF